MNAPGKVLLMVTSILLIVFGCISVYMMLTYFGIIHHCLLCCGIGNGYHRSDTVRKTA
jgi:hypothetical protein